MRDYVDLFSLVSIGMWVYTGGLLFPRFDLRIWRLTQWKHFDLAILRIAAGSSQTVLLFDVRYVAVYSARRC